MLDEGLDHFGAPHAASCAAAVNLHCECAHELLAHFERRVAPHSLHRRGSDGGKEVRLELARAVVLWNDRHEQLQSGARRPILRRAHDTTEQIDEAARVGHAQVALVLLHRVSQLANCVQLRLQRPHREIFEVLLQQRSRKRSHCGAVASQSRFAPAITLVVNCVN